MGIFDIFKKSRPQSRPKSGQRPGKSVEKARPIIKTGKPPLQKHKGEIYRILKEPHISEKATHLSDERKYTFKVYSKANKVEIAKAIGNLYGVKIKDVNIINIKSKKRTLRGLEGTKPGYKKAIVTLEQGEKIEIMPH